MSFRSAGSVALSKFHVDMTDAADHSHCHASVSVPLLSAFEQRNDLEPFRARRHSADSMNAVRQVNGGWNRL
jgi:hypothetical protein